ncbi:MAG: branched-chain amino acid ABC transporter permease [Terriglobales bacterium]
MAAGRPIGKDALPDSLSRELNQARTGGSSAGPYRLGRFNRSSHNMLGFLASVIDGVLVGFVYGLAAMGLTLIWGVMDVVNLTHGAMIVCGMFGLYALTNVLGIPVYAALLPVLVGGFIVGVGLYWLAIHRVVGRPSLMSLLSTFSVNLVLVGLGTAVLGTGLFNVDVSVPGFSLGRYTFPGAHIVAAILAAIIAYGLYLFLHRAKTGKAVRAVASNREAAELVGIPTTRVLAVTVGTGVASAAVAGMLIATLFPFTVLSGDDYTLKSFVVTVLGGFGNPLGALFAGVALGVLEGAVTPFVPVSWTLVIEFALFVVALIAFPGGLFASRRGAL